jgi:sarcosine oxidase/L-pipecolate oxidase
LLYLNILEKIVSKKLLIHLQTNNLLYEHQYGFLPKRATEHNLMQVTNFITSALNDEMFCLGVFIDLRKAFDVCSHKILLKKLKSLGVDGIALKWFESYLSNRLQCVEIDGILSDEKCFNISVIQGSILGTILFLCYINDFYKCTTLLTTLFADDGSCLAKNKNLLELIAYVNLELQKIANWFLSNKMAINTSKTKFILFRTQGKKVNDDICKIVYNNNEIGKIEDPLLIYPIYLLLRITLTDLYV